jgi:two-component system chemotaxis response regulator CheB
VSVLIQQKPMRVLVVDDSAFNRRTLGDLLAAIPGVEVIGKAADGDEALRLAVQLEPDLITLDLEMPRMDGFTFLRLLMARKPTPVIVVSGYSAKENVFRALELGALDFVAKPARTVTTDLSAIQKELAEKVTMVRMLTPSGADPRRRGGLFRGNATVSGAFPAMPDREMVPPTDTPRRVVVIGSSTGGPTALLEVFARQMPHTSAAFVVAQHMPEKFTRTFADRLDRLGGVRVTEAYDLQPLKAAHALICPGGRCIEIVRGPGNTPVVRVMAPTAEDRYVPSADRLFESAASIFGDRVVAVVLTGMGDDGARGIGAVKRSGGTVLAESAETAVIYGMPGAAARTGLVDKTLPPRTLAEQLALLVTAPPGDG